MTEFGGGIKEFMSRYRHGVTPISAALDMNDSNGNALQPIDITEIIEKNPLEHMTSDSLRIKHNRNKIKYTSGEKFIPALPHLYCKNIIALTTQKI